MEGETNMESETNMIKNITKLIDKALEKGIKIELIDNKIYEHINKFKSREYRSRTKKTKKKKKICRAALFISDSSDNEINEINDLIEIND